MEDHAPSLASRSALIWQGFHHTWTYNHRLNRFGSYAIQAGSLPGSDGPLVVHAAASGTGGDSADFVEFATWVADAKGVAFQAGVAETVLECQRGDPEPFVIRIADLPLAPELQGRDVMTVVINGFDLIATEHAEKLLTLDIEASEPVLTTGGTRARLQIFGNLCFDCRSSECQLLPLRVEIDRGEKAGPAEQPVQIHDGANAELPEPYQKRGISRRKVDRTARWVKQRLIKLTDVEEVKRSIAGDDGDILRRRLFRMFGRSIFLKFLKWRFSAPYTLRVYYLIIAGDADALRVTESPDLAHAYSWDLDHEIHQEELGVKPIRLEADSPARYAVNTLAFKRLHTDVIIDERQGTEDPIQWGKGMHLLAWNLAIRDLVPTDGVVRAELDLFFKNWSEAMNEVITLTTWGAVRAAGTARFETRLALLQFRSAKGGEQRRLPGRIRWPGGGLSAETDRRASYYRTVPGTHDEEAHDAQAP
ncbi:MAG: hypothetical protein JXC32_12640 [Anaerolineae bacterium]|nr:hypothetical protein [Anaerolineae bacterium]